MWSFWQGRECGLLAGGLELAGEKMVKIPRRPIQPVTGTDCLVDTDAIIEQTGPIALAGRYSCTRPLDSDFTMEPKVVLGTGMGGEVRLGKCLASGRRCAIKSLKKNHVSSRQRELVKNEAEVHLQVDHPHIAKLERIYETQDALHFVMEPLDGGELFDRIARGALSEEKAADAARQMLLAVAYMHAHGLVHRDIKPENFLYERDDYRCLKLIDFGFARRLAEGEKIHSSCGTMQYTAPEVLRQSYTEKADLWSLGIATYVMLCAALPYPGEISESQLYKHVVKGTPYFSRTRFDPLSDGAKQFVRSLLNSDPSSRPSAAEALQHPWICGRRAANVTLGTDAMIMERLQKFAQVPQLQRVCWALLARSSRPPPAAVNDELALREHFLAIAAQGRGTIGAEELRKALGSDCAAGDAQVLFDTLAASGCGEITYTEFLTAASYDQELCDDAFRSFDSTGLDGGHLTAEAISTLLGHSREAEPEEAQLEQSAPQVQEGTSPCALVDPTLALSRNSSVHLLWENLVGTLKGIPKDLSSVSKMVLRLFDFDMGLREA